jgi:methylglutaconyl-CoA hydratase
MKYSTITVHSLNRVTTITLNRPNKRNALDDVVIKELTDAVQASGRMTDTRVIILTGTGSTFCAGMDLEYLQKYSQLSQEENLEDAKSLLKLLSSIASCKKPVIAMVNGAAMGGGCGLAAACDFVFASESAKLGTPEVRLGFVPAVILFFLIKRIGEGKAKQITLQGNTLLAKEAKEIGLVNDVYPDNELQPMTINFAEQLAKNTSPSSIALTKDLFLRLSEMTVSEFLEYSTNLNALARKTEDFKKGIESFIKKEKLQW